MSKLTSFKAMFKTLVSKGKKEFLQNKFKFILKICCWICFVVLTLNIQLLTMLETYRIVPVVLTIVFAFFIFLQLIVLPLFGMLVYEKRFYAYIAIFALIFSNENCKVDMYCCVKKLKKFKFVVSIKLLNFVRSNSIKLKKDLKLEELPFSLKPVCGHLLIRDTLFS